VARRKAQRVLFASLQEESASPHGAPSAAVLGEGSVLPDGTGEP